MSDPSWMADVKAIFDGLGVPLGIWMPLMVHESNGYPGVVNDTRGQDTKPGTVPEYSVGLFQINVHAMGLSPAEEEALAEKLKDPVENAKWMAPRIAAAWDYVRQNKAAVAAAEGLPAEYGLSGAVAVRAGFPGGSVDFPCQTAYCKEVELQFAETERQLNDAINSWTTNGGGATDFLSAWWSRTKGQPSIYGSGSGGSSGSSGSSASGNSGSGSTTNAAYYGGGAGAGAAAAAVPELLTGKYWTTDNRGLRLALFALGAGLVLFAVWSILSEGANKTVRVIVKGAAQAASGNVAGAADTLAGD